MPHLPPAGILTDNLDISQQTKRLARGFPDLARK